MSDQQERYSDEELEEFRQLILEKLALTREDYEHTMDAIMNRDNNEADDTAPTYHALEEGSEVQSKEQLMAMAMRQQKFIQGLKAALIRIDNKTYGICRETGKLIPKERLRAVPHATLSIEVKNDRKRHH
jgi:RNA polymerase-binding protein DksA